MSADISALLLCGGAGHRMGGADKPLLNWQGQPLLQHVLLQLQGDVHHVVVSANRNAERYRQLVLAHGFTLGGVVADAANHTGPLAGVCAGLALSPTTWTLVCPADTPLIPANLATTLALHAGSDIDAVVVDDGERRQNLHVLVRSSLRDHVCSFVSGGGYKVYEWLAQLRCKQVRVGTPAQFRNFNTPDEFASDQGVVS